MTKKPTVIITMIMFMIIVFISGCAPKITFYVTKPPRLPIDGIDTVTIGNFEDQLKAPISLPSGITSDQLKRLRSQSPKITRFAANKTSAPLVESMLLTGLSRSGQYRIIQNKTSGPGYSGVLPDPSKTGIINAKVRYFEFTKEDAENMFYMLIATKGNLSLEERLALLGLKATVIAQAEKAKKGFEVKTAYIETIAAMEIEFDFIRQSDGKKLAATQTFTSYYAHKWGGDQATSHLPGPLKTIATAAYPATNTIFDSQAAGAEISMSDMESFLAQGGKLDQNSAVPVTKLDTKTILAKAIVSEYLKQISQYTVQTTLSIAAGDPIAVNFIKGNAYNLAINRLENIERSEADSFNLALAYESEAEYFQAAKYYTEALDKNPGNQVYKNALARVSR